MVCLSNVADSLYSSCTARIYLKRLKVGLWRMMSQGHSVKGFMNMTVRLVKVSQKPEARGVRVSD